MSEDPMENLIDTIQTVTDTQPGPRLRRRARVVATDDPRAELKTLVQQHEALTKKAVALSNVSKDRVAKQTVSVAGVTYNKGDKIPSSLPIDIRIQFGLLEEACKKAAVALLPAIKANLKAIPIYQHFLGKVFGIKGGVVAAYLVASIDIHKAIKPSNLRRFCGLAVIDGRLEKNRKGSPAKFSTAMRTRLYQGMDSMARNCRKTSPGFPGGKTNKYMNVWLDATHRKLSLAKDGRIDSNGQSRSAPSFAKSFGWLKAAERFVEDLYIVWRAIEGLDVWPNYLTAMRGYSHGGNPADFNPRKMTLDEALSLVGDLSESPYQWKEVPQLEAEIIEEELEEELSAAAE